MPTNVYKNFNTSGSVNVPALRYPAISGISAPANSSPDQADSGVVIPLRLTAYSSANSKQQVSTIDTMPITNPSGGFAIGGKTLGYGPSELPKIQMEGYIDTPCTSKKVSGELLNIPSVTFNSMNVTYADIIAAHSEGRTNVQNINVSGTVINGMWSRINPSWFRDPFGKAYLDPKIISFSAGYVEQVPGRTTFTMILQVQQYDY